MNQFIIIGNSAAGIAGLEAIREKDKDSKVIVISDENYSAYCRCMISYYLAKEVSEDNLLYRPKNFYKENNVELLLNKKVTKVDPKKNRIICEDKSQLGYDALLIATGSTPKFPEIPGIKKRGVFGFRTIKDVKEIEGLVPVTKTACIMGGGLIGLKAAYALKKRNIDVKVIIKSKQVLSQMLDFEAALLVQKKLEEHGIEIIFNQDVTEVIGDEGELKAVKLDSGKVIGCSLIIVGKGVSPNLGLVKDTEIKVSEGIIADGLLRTSIPNIYVAGDVAETYDITLGKHSINALWPIAVEQGRLAGSNMAGDKINYEGSVGMNSIEFFGLPIVSLGIFKINPDDKSFEELKLNNVKENIYKKIILRGNALVGAIFAGDIKNSGVYLRLIRKRVDVSSIKDKLLEANFGYPDVIDLIKEKEKLYV
ncbi:MAG: FAD-dependent oxidoreductase [Candidatus Omnitrophica bacterium]|nr:FAD-dependent oxidoreductase [Candidatus Omnitrophota bacterium]